MTLRQPGTHLIAYRSNPATIELPAEKFNEYLVTEGNYEPLTARLETGMYDAPGRERYTRYAKALLVCAGAKGKGKRNASLASTPIGHRLEIIPDTDPLALEAGATEIDVHVLFEGQPLAGAVVCATPAAHRDTPVRKITHPDGRVRFTLDCTGPWMVSLVHMVECKDCSDADWDSSWATLVFHRGEVIAASITPNR